MRHTTTYEDAEIEKGIDHLMKLLIHANDNRRHEVADRLMLTMDNAVRVLLANRLIDALGNDDEDLDRRAVASLIEMGAPIVPDLVLRLLDSGSASLQVRLVAVLARIGKSLSPVRRTRIQCDLDIALFRTRRRAVARAIAKAQAELVPTASEHAQAC